MPGKQTMKSQPTDILLVEDNPDHTELILDALQNHKIINVVHCVADGEMALDFVYQRRAYSNAPRPGLILLDIKLPRISGIEVLKQIKMDENLHTIPVIMLTTSGAEADVQASYQNYANSYIVKPMDYEKLMVVIHELKLYWLIRSRLPG